MTIPATVGFLLAGFLLGAAGAAAVAWVALRRHVRKVREAERRARTAERMAEIGAMTGGLAHEIKNPLSTIGLNAQLLAEAVQDLEIREDERGRLLNRVKALRREAERLRDILTDFLEFAGRIHVEPVPTDLNTLVDELVDFYYPEAERLGVRLRAEPAPGPVMAEVDPKLIKQAALNLLLNAAQAIAGAGSGGVKGEGGPREVILRTERASDHDRTPVVRLHVIDTGPGIPPETLARIFDPYFTTKAGGSGLGLPTSRRIIEEHAGRLEAYSEPGRGSDFVIVLPVSRPG